MSSNSNIVQFTSMMKEKSEITNELNKTRDAVENLKKQHEELTMQKDGLVNSIYNFQ